MMQVFLDFVIPYNSRNESDKRSNRDGDKLLCNTYAQKSEIEHMVA